MTGSENPLHGAVVLPRVCVNCYNIEIRDGEGFVGDRANKRAFQARLEEWRKRLRGAGDDPLHGKPTHELYRDKQGLQDVLLTGDSEAAGMLLGAIEDYAQELAKVVDRLLQTNEWAHTQRIAAGGGFREGRVGELAIGRASVLLKRMSRHALDIVPIDSNPDDAGLIGSIELVTADVLSGHGGFLAVDIGGTNIRAGIVATAGEAADCRRVRVVAREVWRHADENPTRDEAVHKLCGMLARLRRQADAQGHGLAPFLGIACPGRIAPDGRIERGAQNLPGDWEADDFNLPMVLHDGLLREAGWDPLIVMHNDAVVQGLSQVPRMRDVDNWGTLTIGTGLGNAHFANR